VSIGIYVANIGCKYKRIGLLFRWRDDLPIEDESIAFLPIHWQEAGSKHA